MPSPARIVHPAKSLLGMASMPADKAISHRYALFGAIARGQTVIQNYSKGADCQSTLGCIRALGVKADVSGTTVTIEGRGLAGLERPSGPLDAGNSGTTFRMLAGILAGQSFESTMTGDDSLCRRPMRRIIDPLTKMGARIAARDDNFAPVTIQGGKLRAIEYRTPVASAQVKTAVLLAGLFADGTTVVEEDTATRDHTEIALREFGAVTTPGSNRFAVEGGHELKGASVVVPGDLSSAAFFLVAAILVPGSNVTIPNVGLNPTRAAILDFLVSLGADVRVSNVESRGGELIGDMHVTGGRTIQGVEIGPPQVPGMIDELPVLAVLGALTKGGARISGAAELRVKESDRIATVAANLRRMGATVTEQPDGLAVEGGARLHGAEIDPHGDHRIAMAFAIAALVADGETSILDADCAEVSFPGFYETLSLLTQ